MMKILVVITAAILLASSPCFTGSVLAGNQELPEVTEEGLVRVRDSEMAIVYADPHGFHDRATPGTHGVEGDQGSTRW